MDNVTHALAGLLLAEATVALHRARPERPERPVSPAFRRIALVVGVITAELPDADLLYAGPALGMGKLGYMLHHRGHTHTVVFALLGALLVWGATLALRRAVRDGPERRSLLALCVAGTLSHIVLDWTNSYGVHPFWPLSNAWHYGDAVFIIEPWLWIAAVPALVLGVRRVWVRLLLGLPLLAVLLAAWRAGPLEGGVLVALFAGAAASLALAAAAAPVRRAFVGLALWVAAEVVFFVAAGAARRELRAAVGPTLTDAVLTPQVGNPFCISALVVEADGPTYRATSAAVATVPAVRRADACPFRAGAADQDLRDRMRRSPRAATESVRWGEEWSAPRAELAALAGNCEIGAALRFVRVPVWSRAADGSIRFADLRYARGAGGFAEIVTTERPPSCPTRVPPWVPPARELIPGPAAAP